MIVTGLAHRGVGFRRPAMNVLFFCEDCSLALMAESILATLGDRRFRAHSAGYAPACAPNGAVIEFLASHHMRVEGLHPKGLERLRRGDAPPMDFIITLADVAPELFAGWPDSKGAVVVVGHQPDLGRALAHLMCNASGPWSIKKGAFWWISNRVRDGDAQVVVRAVVSPDLL